MLRSTEMTKMLRVILAVLAAGLAGCGSSVRNEPQTRESHYRAPEQPDEFAKVGFESQDIVSCTDAMVRDILKLPTVANRATPPRIVMDSKYFSNDSSSIFDKNMLTDRLRSNLIRASMDPDGKQRIVFLARESAPMVEEERMLENSGAVTGGTQGPTKAMGGWDYRLTGRVTSLDSVGAGGRRSRYHQITFELVERGSSAIVWSSQYEFKKAGRDTDRLYR
jgi:hypothetical protein